MCHCSDDMLLFAPGWMTITRGLRGYHVGLAQKDKMLLFHANLL